MRDIHSHIMYGIDDGSRNIEESVCLLNDLEKNGITDIILTPHYIENTDYTCTREQKENIINELKHYTNINLYIGNEVYICDNLPDLILEGKISTLNNSRYLLIELPMNNKIINLTDILNRLIEMGIIPIIAHPERYKYVQNDIHYLDDIKEMGVLFQGNYESLFGKYGKGAKMSLKELLKYDYISFLGSDIHRVGYQFHHNQVYKAVKKIVKNEQKVNELIDYNIKKVIDDVPIKD